MQPWRTRPDGGNAQQQQSATTNAVAHADWLKDGGKAGGKDGPVACSPSASSGGGLSTPATGLHQNLLSTRWVCLTQDASGGERRRSADDESGSVRAIYFDGGGLLATADGGCVRLWSIERRRRICTLKNHKGFGRGGDELHAGGVSSIAIEGSHLLSGGGDGALHLFDLEELTPAASLRGHGSPISDGCLLPAGSHRARAISSSVDGAVKLWDATGAVVAELLHPVGVNVPPAPLPLALEVHGGTTPRSLYCARAGFLHAIDLHTEAIAATVPLPGHHRPMDLIGEDFMINTALHVACASSGLGGGAVGPGAGSAHLVASCCLNKDVVHIWDARLLPAAATVDEATASFDELSAASRRCLVASINLPVGAACARQVDLDGARLLASIDSDHCAPAFSRGAQSTALYDIRAVGANNSRAPGQPRSDGCLLWEQSVRGEISCFQRRGERVFVGTATGAVHQWHFARSGAPTLPAVWDGNEQADKKPKREKFRPKTKVRGRFPKTQGFSNQKGFR